jgi:hypothetical protein
MLYREDVEKAQEIKCVRRILLPAQHDVNKMNLPPPPGSRLHNCHIGTLPTVARVTRNPLP